MESCHFLRSSSLVSPYYNSFRPKVIMGQHTEHQRTFITVTHSTCSLTQQVCHTLNIRLTRVLPRIAQNDRENHEPRTERDVEAAADSPVPQSGRTRFICIAQTVVQRVVSKAGDSQTKAKMKLYDKLNKVNSPTYSFTKLSLPVLTSRSRSLFVENNEQFLRCCIVLHSGCPKSNHPIITEIVLHHT